MTSHGPQIKRILLTVFFCNLTTASLKTIGGGMAQSISMQADGMHDFLDAASSLVAFIALFLATRPPDDSHPYGRGKYETFASFCISVFLFLGGFHILKESFIRFQSGVTPHVTPMSFIIMLVGMVVNFAVSRWEIDTGRRYRSEVLVADGRHTQSDLWSAMSVIVSLAAGKAGYPVIDPIVGLVIAVIIGRAGASILMESSRVLTDASRIPPREIESVVMAVDGVRACHKVRTRGNFGQVYVDLHIHVPPEMTMEAAHLLVHRIEATLIQTFPEITEVVVHTEPDLPNLEND